MTQVTQRMTTTNSNEAIPGEDVIFETVKVHQQSEIGFSFVVPSVDKI